MTNQQTYLFNGKKVQIQDSRRTGEDINYVYLDEKGVRGSLNCSLSEFDDYFMPTNDLFKIGKVKNSKDNIVYDVVYMVGNRVLETIKSNLPKGRAFGFKQWVIKNAAPGGSMSNY